MTNNTAKSVKGILKSIRNTIRDAIYQLPGGRWLLGWLDPLHISRLLLTNAVTKRAYYAQGSLLDIGCGIQPYRALFNHVESYVGIDLPDTSTIDIAASGLALPFKRETFNTILCNEVLEHVPEPSTLFSEAARVLKPNGILLLTTPQTWGLHHVPYDFYRYTKYGLQYLATKHGLEVIEVTPTSGLWATSAQRVSDTIIHTYLVRQSRIIIWTDSILLAPFLLIGYIMDKIFGKRGDTLDNVLVARKPSIEKES